MNYILDLTSFTCPVPLFIAKKALTQLESTDTLTLILRYQSTIEDIKQLCQQQHYQLLHLEQINSISYRLTLQK